jgi:geranylgeranyl reductase family protein
MIYDIIIVGGSAIGLFLAKEFAERGKSVLVLEKNNKIGQKVCSGLVSLHIFDYFSKEDLDNFVEKEIRGARLWIGKKPFDFDGRAFVLNREKLDIYLFKKAMRAGAKILLESGVTDIREKNENVEVFLRSGAVFKGKVLAGCDGAHSIVAKKAGFPRQKKLLFGVICYIKETQKENDNFVELFFSKNFSGFFAWRIPREELTEWGIALDPKEKPLKKLENFLKGRGIDFDNPKGAFIPYFPLKRTSKNRIFLCGDAAGQIKPHTGGGLIYGFRCAQIAAKLINNFQQKEIQDYEKEWRKSLMKEIRVGSFLKNCYSLPNFIKKTGLSFLKNRQNLDQDNPSSILRF